MARLPETGLFNVMMCFKIILILLVTTGVAATALDEVTEGTDELHTGVDSSSAPDDDSSGNGKINEIHTADDNSLILVQNVTADIVHNESSLIFDTTFNKILENSSDKILENASETSTIWIELNKTSPGTEFANTSLINASSIDNSTADSSSIFIIISDDVHTLVIPTEIDTIIIANETTHKNGELFLKTGSTWSDELREDYNSIEDFDPMNTTESLLEIPDLNVTASNDSDFFPVTGNKTENQEAHHASISLATLIGSLISNLSTTETLPNSSAVESGMDNAVSDSRETDSDVTESSLLYTEPHLIEFENRVMQGISTTVFNKKGKLIFTFTTTDTEDSVGAEVTLTRVVEVSASGKAIECGLERIIHEAPTADSKFSIEDGVSVFPGSEIPAAYTEFSTKMAENDGLATLSLTVFISKGYGWGSRLYHVVPGMVKVVFSVRNWNFCPDYSSEPYLDIEFSIRGSTVASLVSSDLPYIFDLSMNSFIALPGEIVMDGRNHPFEYGYPRFSLHDMAINSKVRIPRFASGACYEVTLCLNRGDNSNMLLPSNTLVQTSNKTTLYPTQGVVQQCPYCKKCDPCHCNTTIEERRRFLNVNGASFAHNWFILGLFAALIHLL